jgi:hypothetical protein
MLFEKLSNEQLLDLHKEVRTMLLDASATLKQHSNLVTLMDNIEVALCHRCDVASRDECIVPGATLKHCKLNNPSA